MKIVERVLQKRLRNTVNVDELQFGFMPGIVTVDALFVLKRIEEISRGEKLEHVFC